MRLFSARMMPCVCVLLCSVSPSFSNQEGAVVSVCLSVYEVINPFLISGPSLALRRSLAPLCMIAMVAFRVRLLELTPPLGLIFLLYRCLLISLTGLTWCVCVHVCACGVMGAYAAEGTQPCACCGAVHLALNEWMDVSVCTREGGTGRLIHACSLRDALQRTSVKGGM